MSHVVDVEVDTCKVDMIAGARMMFLVNEKLEVRDGLCIPCPTLHANVLKYIVTRTEYE